ncbi:MAG: hypothetical protein ABW133_24155 [Polyangiaceae bacterium]
MIRSTTYLSGVLFLMMGLAAACSDDQGVGQPDRTGSGGTGGSATGGSGGAGGSKGGTGGTGGATGGSGGATGGSGGTATGGTGGATGGSGGATGGTGGAGTGGTAGKGGAAGSGGATGGTGGTAGTGGATGGSAGTGGATGGTAGTAGTAGTGGTGGTTDAGSKDAGSVDAPRADVGTTDSGGGGTNPDAGSGACGPMRGADPTETSVQAKGTFTVMSYTDSPASSGYKASTVYYPSDATPPFVGVAAVPGLNGVQSSVGQWGPFLASHGYAVIVIDTNSTGEQPSQRATALMAAITTLKGEGTRSGSPLNGKMSSCMVVMGHSMGGGGSVIAANMNSSQLKGVIGLSPYGGGSSSSNISVPTLLFVATGDPLSSPGTHVKPAYQGIPAGTNKMYIEFPGSAHDIAQFPTGSRATDPTVARYGLSWLKFNVDGDARYRPFLNKVASGLADYQTNLP